MDLQCLGVTLAAFGPARKVSSNECCLSCHHMDNYQNACANPSLQVSAKKNVFIFVPCGASGGPLFAGARGSVVFLEQKYACAR